MTLRIRRPWILRARTLPPRRLLSCRRATAWFTSWVRIDSTSQQTTLCGHVILHECHDVPTAGHLGKDKTMEQVKRRFYWPRMDADVLRYVRTCDACQRNKPSQQATPGSAAATADPDSSVAAGDDGSHHAAASIDVGVTMRSSCSWTS